VADRVRADDIVPIHVADVTYPEGHPLAGQTGPVMVFVVRHPQGILLIDTGVGSGHAWIDEHYQPRTRPIKVALFAARIDADAVGMIVNTHMHFDHAGQNAEYPDIPIVVQDAEWSAAWDEGYTVREWIDFEDANYVRVIGDTEIAPGIRVLATPGHSPGHQSVAVDTDDGLVLIAGQAAQDARDFATREPDPSLRRLRELNAAQIHFSHDRAVLKRTSRHGVAPN
jgi:glyoxylase-like metal-dependent hydrolase (beta-lactamase superfamily II)